MQLTPSIKPITTGGPVQPHTAALLSSMFLLREIELAGSKLGDWTIDEIDQEVSWNLPGSKTDPKALGVSRKWGCLCGLNKLPCPYHLALRHSHWLRN